MLSKEKRHGGKRPGAGRKAGSGRYGEPTSVIRVPRSKIEEIKNMLLSSPSRNESEACEITKVSHVFRPQIKGALPRPLYTSRIAAGLPAAVEDHSDEEGLDLNEHLLKNPASTFFVRVSGDSMIDAGIHPGDLLVVDRSIPATNGRIVVAVVNGESTVKRLIREKGHLYLMPENSAYSSIEIKDETTFMVWGVVTNVIHAL